MIIANSRVIVDGKDVTPDGKNWDIEIHADGKDVVMNAEININDIAPLVDMKTENKKTP